MLKILVMSALGALATLSYAQTDLRVLIDVSGSMKSNDPNALRQPAAELIARLLPPQSQAGVWLFGTQTRALVDYGVVDPQWRTATLSSSDTISSSDQYTDIEQSLTEGLQPATHANKQCHVILVTDGLIDLRAGQAAIRESRARIETQVIAQARQQDCRIHTLSLSDQTDKALLNRLSQATGGLSAQLTGAAQLLPVVLDALELALPDNRLPIQGQSFQVDESVNKQTIISLTPTDQALQLVSPSGQIITPDNLPENVEYQTSQGFQLYQITNPEPGIWQSLGDAKIDRVLADADINLSIIDLPGTLELGQPLNVVVRITQGDQAVQLNDLDLRGTINDQPLTFEARGDDLLAPVTLDQPGSYILEIQARSGLFERTLNRTIEVIEPQVASALESGTTQGVQTFKAPAAVPAIEVQATPVVEPVSTNEGLTLLQWLWIIGAAGLGLIVLIAFWLSRAEKKA